MFSHKTITVPLSLKNKEISKCTCLKFEPYSVIIAAERATNRIKEQKIINFSWGTSCFVFFTGCFSGALPFLLCLGFRVKMVPKW